MRRFESNASRVAAAVVAALAFCSLGAAQVVPAEWGRLWLYRPTEEMPPWCLKLHDGGQAEFVSEYEFLNPVSWKRDPGSGDLALSFASLDHRTAANLRWKADHPTRPPHPAFAELTAFDEAARTVRYRITPASRFLEFSGHILARPEALEPSQREHVPKRCFAGPPPGVEPGAAR